ncbi:MAG TPA: pirin family protein [Thermoplasmata archaeon]
MKEPRAVSRILSSRPTLEGAGVHLKRAFGNYEVPLLDPFLLLDDFHSPNPRDYILGFPWHPHRGIETVTYMIRGSVDHGDSMGNVGAIGSGGVQWMTAGSGIIHQEMPRPYDGMMQGFQLWMNLPSSKKMMGPRYRSITDRQIPITTPSRGVGIRVIAGKAGRVEGPVRDLVVEAEYLDVDLKAHTEFEHQIRKGNRAFAYIFEGQGFFDPDNRYLVANENLVIFGDGDHMFSKAGKNGMRFLLVSGKPIGEPVAWRGPIVMNTEKELDIAFEEYWNGKFIKHLSRL